MNILVVEDDPQTRELLETILASCGYGVTACPDGELALDAYRAGAYGILLLDLGLPGMDGLTLCRQIRALPQGALSMIMIITGYDDPDTLEAVLDAGADDYLIKPISGKTLKIRLTIIARQYQHRLQRRQAEENLLTYREQLEDVVEDRTRKIQQTNISLRQQLVAQTNLRQALQESEAHCQMLEQEKAHWEQQLLARLNDGQAAAGKYRDSEAKFRALLDSSPQSFMLVDRHFNLQAFNRTAQKDAQHVYGVELHEGEPFNCAMFASDAESVRVYLRRALQGESVAVEEQIVGQNQMPYWFIFQYNPVNTEDGETIGVCLSVSDSTARKQLELTLQETKQTAEGANTAKSQFLSNLSHELRTPLNIILGYSQLLSNAVDLPKKQRHAVDAIYHSGEQLLRLVEDILDFSRLDVQQVSFQPANFNLLSFFTEVVHEASQTLPHNTVTVKCEIMSDLPTIVSGDVQLLRQVLQHLLNNAIKFTPRGAVTLRIGAIPAKASQLHGSSATDQLIRVQVEDTGIGMAPEELHKIFLPFYQIYQTQVPKSGTGLGLAICRKLVRLMRSELYVESVEGGGTIFWCDLDLPQATGPITSAPLNLPALRDLTGYKGPAYTLLLVDDDHLARKALADLLTPLGFTVHEAVNGHDAINKAMAHKPDVILMDLVMPVLDGFEAVRQLRRLPEFRDVIILAISARAFANTRKESFLVGCNDFVTKPLYFQDILLLLQTHLHLEWTYARPPRGLADAEEKPSDEAALLPPLATIERLLEIADVGNITEFEHLLEQIKAADSEYLSFVVRMQAFAQHFEFEKIIEELRLTLEESTARR